MNEDELTNTLKEIGLTEYQSKAYVAAVSLGSATPNELAESSDVPQPRIYDVIDDLREMGLIEVQEHSGGKEVRAPSPAAVLEQYKDRHIDTFTERIQSITNSLENLHEYERSSRAFVTMVNLEESALRHIKRAIEEANWWVTLALPVDFYREVLDQVEAALDRGVTVRLILSGTEPITEPRADPTAPPIPEGMLVRHRSSLDTFAFADRTYGIFNSKHPEEESQPYIISQERNLVMLFQNYSEQIWAGSDLIERGDGLPKRYLDPWRVIVDLREQLDRGEPLVAEVDGRETHSRRAGTWRGDVVDYELVGAVESPYEAILPTRASLDIETDDGVRSIGGWKATVEDIAADGLTVKPVGTEGEP